MLSPSNIPCFTIDAITILLNIKKKLGLGLPSNLKGAQIYSITKETIDFYVCFHATI